VRRSGAQRRRSGPPGEQPWWDPIDQAAVEAPLLRRRELGKGWIPTLLVNNAEQLDPHGDDPDGVALRQVRDRRRLTGLDEGAAWRHRRTLALIVSRVEAYAQPDDGSHRLAWRERGAASLDALWRQRWRERDLEPGWIEARWVDVRDRVPPLGVAVRGDGSAPEVPELDQDVADAVDWIHIEDQTQTPETGRVACFEHLTIWAGRGVATLVVRHDQVDDLDPTAAAAAARAHGRLAAALRSNAPG
jgi:hypothetical protein